MGTDITKGLLSILSAKIGVLLISLLLTPLLVRILGSTDYGIYAFLISLLSVCMILVNGGVFDGIRKFVAEDRSDVDWANHVLGFYARFGSASVFFMSSLFVLSNLAGITTILLGDEYELYLYLLAVLIAVRQWFMITRSALMGRGLESISEPMKVGQRSLFAVLGLTFAYLGHGVVGILLGHIVASSIVAGIGTYYLSREYQILTIFKRAPDDFPVRELIGFNLLSIVLVFLIQSLYHTDILLLNILASSQETGQYKAALVIAEFLWFVPTALQMVLLHSTSKIWADQDTAWITTISSQLTRYNLLLSLLLVIGVAALAEPFVTTYFGSEFQPAVVPLLILLPGAFGFALTRPIYAIGQGKGELRVLIIATCVAAIGNFVLNLILIPQLGTHGAAVATSVGYGSMLVLHYAAARNIGFNPFADLRLRRIVVATAVTTPVIFSLANLLPGEILPLLIVPPVGFTTYSILLLRTGAISHSELEPVLGQLPNSISTRLNHLIALIGS